MFDGDRVEVEQLTTTVTVGAFATARLGWSVSLGAVVAGSVEGRDLAGGGALGGSVSWLPVYERARRPFVGVSASLGGALVRATADDGETRSWRAFDLRGGVMIGKTLATRWVPYAAARGFGGPVSWRRGGVDVTGSDRYHLTAGAGLTVRLPRDLDVTVEVMPLGERSATAGLTLRL